MRKYSGCRRARIGAPYVSHCGFNRSQGEPCGATMHSPETPSNRKIPTVYTTKCDLEPHLPIHEKPSGDRRNNSWSGIKKRGYALEAFLCATIRTTVSDSPQTRVSQSCPSKCAIGSRRPRRSGKGGKSRTRREAYASGIPGARAIIVSS